MSLSLRTRRLAVIALVAALPVAVVGACGVPTNDSVALPRGFGDAKAASPGQAGRGVAASATMEARAATVPAAPVDGTTPVIPVPNAQNVAVTSVAPTTGIVTDGTGTLTVVNLATRTVTGKIDIPYENFHAGTVTAQPGSPFVWVGNNQGNFIAIVNAQTKKFVKAVDLPEGPGGGAYVTNGFISMGKDRAFVLNSFWSGWEGMPPTSITRVDLKTQEVVDQLVMPDNGLATPAPANGVLSASGNSIYVAAWAQSGQGVFEMTFAVPGATPSPGTIWRQVASLPYVDALTGSGTDLYATQDTENHASRISTVTNTVTGTIPFATGTPAADTMASSLIVSPDGRQLWEGDFYAGHVNTVNLASSEIAHSAVGNLAGNFASCPGVGSICVPTAAGIALFRAE